MAPFALDIGGSLAKLVCVQEAGRKSNGRRSTPDLAVCKDRRSSTALLAAESGPAGPATRRSHLKASASISIRALSSASFWVR